MENLVVHLHNYMFIGAAFLFIFQAIILFVRGKNDTPKKTMALMELIWGGGYVMALTLLNLTIGSDEFVLFREKYVVLGGFYISFMALYLMQVLIPGWLNWKRFFLVESPFIALAITFYGGVALFDEKVDSITSYVQLGKVIFHFNVWFRFAMLFIEMIYIIVILRWLHGFKNKYIQWENENFADQENVDISWIRSYCFIIIGITIFYLGVFFIGGRVPILFHTTFVVVSFSYLFYKALFYESPYPTDFFESLDEDKQKMKSEEIFVIAETKKEECSVSESAFGIKVPEYIDILTKWMSEEKPYLYTGFKLTDVSRVLPMNRSYISRVFNEGFGKNFSEVVRDYRVEYSVKLLRENPDMPIHKIAELSGFNSEATYARAFRLIKGMSPAQFKAGK